MTEYYLQDTRGCGCVGNDILFWAKDGRGYTTDVSKAHIFTEEKAFSQHRCLRLTDHGLRSTLTPVHDPLWIFNVPIIW